MGKRQKIVRCHNQSGLLQCSMRHARINPRLGLGLQGGSKSMPRPRIAMRPKLARSFWFDTMMGTSLRETGTQRETGWAVQGSLLLASPQQGVSPNRSIQQGTGNSWLHLRHAPVGLALKSYRPWSRRKVPLCLPKCYVQLEVLQASVGGPCLPRPENWFMRQLIDLKAKVGIWSRIY
jgi:hypothetical protein